MKQMAQAEMYAMIAESDLSIILIADAAIAENYEKIFTALNLVPPLDFHMGL